MQASTQGIYIQGDTRDQMAGTEGREDETWSESQKAERKPDKNVELNSVKSEAILKVERHATEKRKAGIEQKERHSMGVGVTGSR